MRAGGVASRKLREPCTTRRRIDFTPIKKLQIPLQQISSEPALSLRFHRIEPVLPTRASPSRVRGPVLAPPCIRQRPLDIHYRVSTSWTGQSNRKTRN